jgi:hypothetical protein
MALTRNFIETIKARADLDPDFRKELLRESVETFLSGDAETGKAILRDYINATVGFGTSGKAIDIDPKSLMRMLGPAGNPKTDNLVEIIKYLQTREGPTNSTMRALGAGRRSSNTLPEKAILMARLDPSVC